jgi:CheY-like chemotaxis protein
MFRVRAAEADLDFSCRVPADLPPVILGDEKRLRQVLINLLGNAIKFTEHGEVALEVSLLSASEGKAQLRFEVRDTGIGIPAAQLAQIFQPFEQAGDIRRRAGGTGLGLSISSQIVRLMNSRIEVDSREGEGSRFGFEVQLPVIDQASAAEVAPVQRPTGYFGSRRRILIVDDTDANRAVLNDWLAELGFDTCEACDGKAALEAAAEWKPDLILMDIKMPVMDGFEATALIRTMDALKGVPIFAVSASATGEVEARSRAAGADAFITKPIDEAELMQLIGRHLKLQWLTAAEGNGEAAPAAELPLTAPPRDELAMLLKHALAGNMRAIRAEADRIAGLDTSYEPFAQKIKALANAYQSPAILRLIEDHGGPRSAAA